MKHTNSKQKLKDIINFCQAIFTLCIICLYQANISNSYPIYAQQTYENPRESTGRIVCANCHLAQKNIYIEAPKEVLPNTVFETVVKIPYEFNKKQILGNGSKGDLNVGAVVILPEGFKLAPKDRMDEKLLKKTKNLYFNNYSQKLDNIIVIGPITGKDNQEITFPILAPDPQINKNTHFLKYSIYVGANKGRGQLYPSGEKSNNNPIPSNAEGRIEKIKPNEDGGYEVIIKTKDDETISQYVPIGLNLTIKEGQRIKAGEYITTDPNVGGFGQSEIEIVLQNPTRLISFIFFSISVLISQLFFVLKKKQFEKVQSLNQNF
uniref:Cytochrome f n=1 Tax=Cyanidium caldarium TaxID=2771 RepID=CYF_CYACA|nr:cytochrome f [Cyanidium caldarium]Q9TLS4.1 RecName: Full=Cytochrome f; Flags: Precursor [Cyanidium caldarium]AAF12899.1 unknown [Cyanidium caldarium]WDB00130.1 cytochrome f [Cyanidium caldarium]